jgi:hypothetical protein
MGPVAMSLKVLSICIGLLLLLVMIPDVESKDIHPYYYQPGSHYFHSSIWLFPYVNHTSGEPSLFFKPNSRYFYYDDYSDYYEDPWYYEDDYWDGNIEIGSNENLTLVLTDVDDRIYNPDIAWELSIDSWLNPIIAGLNVTYQLRFDGDGDGNFEYIVEFNEDPQFDWLIEPTSFDGEPINMTDGTIELFVSRPDNSSVNYVIRCGPYNSYIQVPFDLDTDWDGTGDYSDSDDDNDGHLDNDDYFPANPNEWKDSDGDGIGDNADEDNNGNGIPDDFEIPLAMGIILIPIVIIAAFMKRMKKSKEKGADKEEEIKPLTTSKIGPKNW